MSLLYASPIDGIFGGGVIIAGAGGGTPPDFFARSAMVARYARFACNRRMHSMYSGLGFCAGALEASEPWSDPGEGFDSCAPCCVGGAPALPAA